MVNEETSFLLCTGESISLGELTRHEPVVLVFLRHYGCAFAREQVELLSNLNDQNILFIGMGDEEETKRFAANFESGLRFACDPDQVLYAAFGLGAGRIGEILGPRVIARGFSMLTKGKLMRRPIGDPRQMPGVFIVDSRGKIRWAHTSIDAADNVSAPEIVSALTRILDQSETSKVEPQRPI